MSENTLFARRYSRRYENFRFLSMSLAESDTFQYLCSFPKKILKNGISSVHFKIVSMRSEKPMCVPFIPSFRSFPSVAFVTVQVFVWLTMALSRPLKEDRPALPLSTPLSSRRSMVRCPGLCDRRECLKFLNTSDLKGKCKPLVVTALPATLSARQFPFTPICPGQLAHRIFLSINEAHAYWSRVVSFPTRTRCWSVCQWTALRRTAALSGRKGCCSRICRWTDLRYLSVRGSLMSQFGILWNSHARWRSYDISWVVIVRVRIR